MQELVQYFIINKDLKMSPGKVAAQVAHVATMITVDFLNEHASKTLEEKEIFNKWYHSNMKKVTLKANQLEMESFVQQGFYFIKDNGLTEIPKGSLTVVGLPPMNKQDAQRYVKKLSLY